MFGADSYQFILLSCLNLTSFARTLARSMFSTYFDSGHLFVNWLLNRISSKIHIYMYVYMLKSASFSSCEYAKFSKRVYVYMAVYWHTMRNIL